MVIKRLDSKDLAPTYPQVGMPFYLYGTPREEGPDPEYHIDHTLAAAPNTQFTAGEVTISMNEGDVLPPFIEASPCIKIIVDFPERAMQPFPPNKDIVNDPDFFFRPGKVLPFTVEGVDVKGSLTLTKNVFVDTDMLNEDPVPEKGKPKEVEPGEGGPARRVPERRVPTMGECYASEYSLRAHAYAVVLLAAPVHTTSHLDTVAPGRGWQDIIVCTLVAYMGMKSHTFVPRIPFRVLMMSRIYCTCRVIPIQCQGSSCSFLPCIINV